MNRREARESAFIIVFQNKFNSNIEEILKDFLSVKNVGKQEKYIKEVVLGCLLHHKEIDSKIKENLREEWSIERLSHVSITLLRLGLYEIYYRKDIPITVTNNEVVNLANIYEGEEAAFFVNGVLGSIQKEIESAAG
ncbi:MAG: transcription antitermination factor NusB [Clostridiales bacterium]|jgi:N utilization substance protein B|nr:transcription antitermination factor NusB [Clostridiales bacterium]